MLRRSPTLRARPVQHRPWNGFGERSCEIGISRQGRNHFLDQELRGRPYFGFLLRFHCQVGKPASDEVKNGVLIGRLHGRWGNRRRNRGGFCTLRRASMVVLAFIGSNQERWIVDAPLHLWAVTWTWDQATGFISFGHAMRYHSLIYMTMKWIVETQTIKHEICQLVCSGTLSILKVSFGSSTICAFSQKNLAGFYVLFL